MDDVMKTAEIVHIVDDGPAIRDSLGLLLEPSGFDARTYDSAKAFLAASRGPGGCVLMDVRMPEIDGLELQQRLDERGIHLPVIVMTGQGDVPLAVRAVKAGAVDFLEKPFDDAALLDAVRRALKESQRLQLSMRLWPMPLSGSRRRRHVRTRCWIGSSADSSTKPLPTSSAPASEP